MKKCFTAILIFCVLFVGISIKIANAKDYWIEDYEDKSFYVVSDTLEYGIQKSGMFEGLRWFNVYLKTVKDGECLNNQKFSFQEMTSEWRVSHKNPSRNEIISLHVTRYNELFKFCMRYIGWEYDESIFWY